jgi:hypothetical protein
MDVSIIGFSKRVKKYYLEDKRLNIFKILRVSNIDNKLFTNKIEDLLVSKFIIISLNSKKTFEYILKLKKLKYDGYIIIETPSISIVNYFLNPINSNIIVLEDLIFTNFILKIRNIIKKEGLKKLIIINRGYFVFYHLLSVIYFWNYCKLPKLNKSKKGYLYFIASNFYVKTNLKKFSNSKVLIKLYTNKNEYKFYIKNSNNYKKNNTQLYLRHISLYKKKLISVKDYNKINLFVVYLKIQEKIFSLLRI